MKMLDMQMKFQCPLTKATVHVYWWTKQEPRRRGEESRHTTHCKIVDPYAGEFTAKTFKHPDDAHDQIEGDFVSLCRAAKRYTKHFSQSGVRGHLRSVIWNAWVEHTHGRVSGPTVGWDIWHLNRFFDTFKPRPKKAAVLPPAESGADWSSYAPIDNPDFIQETVPPPDVYGIYAPITPPARVPFPQPPPLWPNSTAQGTIPNAATVENERLRIRVKELEDALRPFITTGFWYGSGYDHRGKIVDLYANHSIKPEWFHQARKILEGGKG